jgi:hypothetical protein
MHLISLIKAHDAVLALLPKLNRLFDGEVEHSKISFQFESLSISEYMYYI